MSLVLIVDPDASQAGVLRAVLQNRVAAELVVVESTQAAVNAIDAHVPDLILVSALLSPRDEDALTMHLRSLETAWHLQTLTIPQLRCERQASIGKSLFGFKKKRPAPAPVGCDPAVFAEEIVAHLARAVEARSHPAPLRPAVVDPAATLDPLFGTIEPLAGSIAVAPVAQPHIEAFDSGAAAVDPFVAIAEPVAARGLASPIPEPVAAIPEPLAEIFEPVVELAPPAVAHQAPGNEDEFEQLARQLGLSVESVKITERDLEAENELALAAELERVRADAAEHRLVELARLQADADAAREAAIAEARAAAELEAREALTAELSRVRSEAESTFTEALDKVKMEAEQSERLRVEAQETFAAELVRVRADVEQTLSAQLHTARVEAERMRAAEAEVARVRAETERVRVEAEARLKSELERVQQDARHTRLADLTEANKATEQIRARAEAEIARVRSQAEAVLQTELQKARAEAEARQRAELEELRSQMDDLREAAAQQARAAAAEAVATEVARATSHSRGVVLQEAKVVRLGPSAVIQFPQEPEPAPMQIVSFADAAPGADDAPEDNAPAETTAEQRSGGDYYSLWQATAESPALPPVEADGPRKRRLRLGRTKWALPIAASVVLVANTGSAISTFSRFLGTWDAPVVVDASTTEKTDPVAAVVEQKFGHLKVDSTPVGATVQIDGRPYGQTPTTVSDLAPGTHTVVLRSDAGTVTRRVTIRLGETAVLSEGIFAGWIAIFSPIPLDVAVNGKPVSPADDGRIMISPGTYDVELVNTRFNYRGTERLEVRPGGVTAHTVSLPSGTLHVAAPEGTEVSVDGAVVGRLPMDVFSVTIGTHEVTATLPELGERRTTVDVRLGEITEARLTAEPKVDSTLPPDTAAIPPDPTGR